MKTKRLLLSSILGLAFGFVCYGFASSGGNEISTILALNIILGRMLIGVAIGISRFSCRHWSVHGLIMGLVFSLPAGFGAMLGIPTVIYRFNEIPDEGMNYGRRCSSWLAG